MRNSDRFTERAEAVIRNAQLAAREFGHSYVGSEHILLGIAREGGGQGAKILRESGLTDSLLTELVEKYVGRGDRGSPAQGLTPRAKRIIELCGGEIKVESSLGTGTTFTVTLRDTENDAV